MTERASAAYAAAPAPRRRRPLVSRVLLAAAVAVALAGLAVGILEFSDDGTLRSWSGSVPAASGTAEVAASRSSWITVGGTAVDHPLVQATESLGADFYLHRAPDGSWSQLGTPYIDARADASATHVLAYGHHVGFTSLVFSDLADDWRQERLDSIGNATVWGPDGRKRVYRPLMAMSVDMGYGKIQRFGLEGAELREWLRDLEGDATARVAGADSLIDGAHGVLTLVTCSSSIGGRSWRTLTVFVR